MPVASREQAAVTLKRTYLIRYTHLTVDSVILLNQIRTIDRRRLVKRFGVLRSRTMKQVDQAILISLALIDI